VAISSRVAKAPDFIAICKSDPRVERGVSCGGQRNSVSPYLLKPLAERKVSVDHDRTPLGWLGARANLTSSR